MKLKHFGSAGQCCIVWIHCSLGLEHTICTLCTEQCTPLKANDCCLIYHGSEKSLLHVMNITVFLYLPYSYKTKTFDIILTSISWNICIKAACL